MFEDLTVWVARAVWRRALIGGLLIGLVGVLCFSVDRVGWVEGVQWWPGAFLTLLVAAALARSRWRGWWALLYVAFWIMVSAAELVGHVLPAARLLQQSPGDWVGDLHVRTAILGQRLLAWSSAIAHGRPVGDTGLFVGLLALIVWGATAWLAWAALRRGQALAASLPAAIVLATNTYLSGQAWQQVLLFFVFALALIIYNTYTGQNTDWERRRVDYPGDMGLDWTTTALTLTLGIGALGAVAPVVATPSGWHVLSDMFASSRQQVVATTNQLFGGVKPPSVGQLAIVARTPDMTNIGSSVDQSPATVMWVKLDEPPPPDFPGAPPPPQHYWRSGVYATYTGTGWRLLPVESGQAALATGTEAPPGRYAVRQQFEIVAEHGQAQFAVNRPISATTGALVGLDPSDAQTALLAGTASAYTVDSYATRVSQTELRAAGTEYPAAIQAAYLQLPTGLPERVRSLATEIVAGASDPYDRAQRLQDYLRRSYAYRLDVTPPPAGRDAVDYFLYDAPGGYCTYFASAMAVMLRTLDVPARVATGYAMGAYDSSRGAYRVVGALAHAWVEVYFPSYGWVEFEPTPARTVFERPAGATTLTPTPALPETGEASPSAAARYWAILVGVLVALAGAGGWVWWQFAARRPTSPRQRVLWLYGRMRAALSRAGLGAPASVTADEYLQASAEVLAARQPLLEAVTEATGLFREAAYSRHPIREADANAAERLWADARLAWIRLTISRIFQRLGS